MTKKKSELKRLKIMIVGINYAPEMISIAVYTSGLAEFFAERGHQVRVVTALPYFPKWQIFDGWPKFRWKHVKSETNIIVTHCPHYVPGNPTGLKRIIHHLSFAVTTLPVALYSAYRIKPDAVFAVAPSILSAPVALAAAKISGAKTWLHVQDFEVEAAFATGLIAKDSFIARLAQTFESWILRQFDKVSSISQPMVKKLHQKNVKPCQTFELRNWADLSKITTDPQPQSMREKLGISAPHIVLYAGNLANKQGLEILPRIAELLTKREDIELVICGDGVLRSVIADRAATLPNLKLFPLQPFEELGNLLAMADVHILPQIASAADLMLPSKLTNMLASGRPVLVTTAHNTALAHEVDGVGVIVEPGNAEAAASAIIALIDDVEMRQDLGIKAVARAYERWNKDRILLGLESELQALTGQIQLQEITA